MSQDVYPPSSLPESPRAPGYPEGARPVLAEPWERDVLEKLVFASLKEQRAKRRWNIFFRLFFIALVLVLIFATTDLFNRGSSSSVPEAHTALVTLDGVIDADGEASAEKVVGALQAAYEDAGTRGVILRINSPGGSPVQSGIIYDEIRRLRELHADKPLYVVVEEICASGGYYVAAAADKIFVNRASIVGSIGVIMEGFGFTGLMDKVGVDRRLVVSGENKALLDPFSPPNPAQQHYASQLVGEIYQQFVTAVRTGRGDRLKETPEMFTGLIWTGAKSVELGLTDGLGTVESVARDVIKAETVVDYTVKENLAERVAKRVGMSFGAGAVNASLGVTQRGWTWR